jgi:hypothetical protein
MICAEREEGRALMAARLLMLPGHPLPGPD